jgi:hypothetical protein
MRSGLIIVSVVSFLLLLTGSVQASANPAAETTNGYCVSSTWMGDAKSSPHDNSGRRLAIVLPVMPSSAAARVPFIQPRKAQKPQVISVTVPANIGQAIDTCSAGAKKLTAVGIEKANELATWLGVFFKQMYHSPVMTPVGGPFACQTTNTPSKFQLWYMRDGRLKTVVLR